MCIKRRHAGFSLVELVMFIVIVSIAVAGILMVLRITSSHSADPQLRKQALAIAEGLLEEVESAHFTYCALTDSNAASATSVTSCTTPQTPGAGIATGRPYANVSDYVGAYGTPQSSFNNALAVLVDAAGNPIASTGSYAANVTITPTPLGPATGPASSTIASDNTAPPGHNVNVLRITVAVNYGKSSITLEGYRTRYAGNAVP